LNISEKIDAELLNRQIFRANDSLKDETCFYKCGLIILSGNGVEFEKDIRHIDRISAAADHFIVKGEMKKALLYTALLKRKVRDFTEKVSRAEIALLAAD